MLHINYSRVNRHHLILLFTVMMAAIFVSCDKEENVDPTEETTNQTYVSELFEYMPAPGQFLNKSPGNKESALSLLGQKGFVSLGAWGGYVVYGFDHTVLNRQGQDDLVIYGNAQPDLAEPGVVWVMRDENGNGQPDDVWHEIAGSESGKEGYIRNYEVTYFRPEKPTDDVPWADNRGHSGLIKTNPRFHQQSYFPDWVTTDSFTLSGTLLPSYNIDKSNTAYITSKPFDFGYADNKLNGDSIDLDDAVDAKGNQVNLSGIDFIKVQTGIQADLGHLGELSTELLGIADLSLID